MKAKKNIKKKAVEKIDEPAIKSTDQFPVVGIGASAGGLDAFKRLLKAIPEDSGMAYVLVQHLDPTHESMLPELLQKVTNIPVMEIADDIKVEPNHIYVIPSNKMMVATDGILVLSPRPPKSRTERNLPIDLFFTSLAEVHQAHAIGVVLSGTAFDGTQGLKAIKDHGGITFAQDEESAAYESMPHSAAQAGVVDFIMPPEKIPQKLLEVTGIINGNGGHNETIPLPDEEMFKQILSLLRIRKGTDFTYYKQSTIRRRILRRMVLNKNEEPIAYLKYLRENKTEQDVLYQDLLIPVTSFFRDQKSFDNLCETVFPLLVKNKTAYEAIRVWVAGCSTGEEAYSIAICLKEFLGDNQQTVQIFATDLSEPAIAKARLGIYTKTELNAVSPHHLKEFFTKNNGGYQVNRNVRDMCVFAHHNFLKDPPFGKMDFISCRNVLIYMEPYLQKKALTTFHYSLNPKGFLLLGKSETTSGVPDLFLTAAKNDKLYTRKDVPGKFIHVASQRSEQNISHTNITSGSEPIRTDFQKTADDIMLRKYTPAGVVVNEAMDIVHFRGNTAAYLQQSPGKPSHNLLQMAKSGMAFELRNILHKAKKDKAAVIKENIPMDVDGSLRNISIEALPLPNVIEPHYLILFHDNESIGNKQLTISKIKTGSSKIKNDDRDLRIVQLEKELAQVREDMRSITEDQEASNEELQSANEELLSSSEELQSLNEELETGKEELQSTNEELMVVNQEMIGLNEQLTVSRDYTEAIIVNIHEPLLVLDKHLRIKTANNAFYKIFRVTEQETEGNLIYNLGNKQWDIPELRTLLEKILPEKSVFNDFKVTHNFSSIGERVMVLNAREVINKKSTEKLILLSIHDITVSEKASDIITKSAEQFKHLVKELPAAVYSCDAQGRISFYNEAAAKLWGRKPKIGKDLWHSCTKMFNADSSPLPIDKAPMAITLKEGRSVKSKEIIFERPDGSRSYVLVHPQPEFDLSGQLIGAINMIFDITELVFARKEVKKSGELFRKLVETAPYPICIFKGPNMELELANDPVLNIWNVDRESAMGKPFLKIIPEMKNQPFMGYLKGVFKTGNTHYGYEEPAYFINENGEKQIAYFNFVYQPYRENDGTITGVMVLATDVTEQLTARKKIEESEKQFRMMAELMPQKIWTSDAEGNKDYFNKTLLDYAGFTSEELLDKGWEILIHPDDQQKNKIQWEECVKTGKDYKAENRLLRKDGKYLWHLTIAVPLKDNDGQIKMWIGSKTEIHEQRQLKEELERSVEKRTQELLETNKELAFQNEEKGRRADELIIANKELAFQNEEKGRRADELIIANKELGFQNKEKRKQEIVNKELEASSHSANLASKYARSLIEASADPLVTISSEGKITDVNEATVKVTGVSRMKLIGTEFSEYFTEPEKAREGYKMVFEKSIVSDYPLTIRHKNGNLTDVLYNASVYKDDKGKVLGVFAAARDVTVQKKIAKELEAYSYTANLASKYARSLIEASGDPLVTISSEGKITDVNEATVKVTGVSRKKLIGTEFSVYFTEPEKAREGYKMVFEKSIVSDYPLTIRHKNGNLTDVLYNASVYKDDKGKVLGVFAAARDVTMQKKISGELTEAKVFAEMATLIAEEAKIKAETETLKAEDAVKSKQQFLSNMSHEIRTPMNAIIGFTKVLLKTDLTAKQKEYLTAVKMSGDTLIVLINDILDLAKVDAGKMTFEQTAFKMSLSIAAMLHMFEPKIYEKNLSLVKEYDNRIPEVLIGDPIRLHQIIINLISNAVKFTSKGKITVSVQMLEEDEEKVMIKFSVSDTGIGIPEGKIDEIFENFQQASIGTSRLYGGTGLGLSIVKQLVEPQGGTIQVKSKLDEGSVFSFILNFKKTNDEVDAQSEILDPYLSEDSEKVRKLKILVVEDIALNQLLMKTLLDDFGFDQDIAANGKIAIEMLMQKDLSGVTKNYDIILMDLQMPEMNGFEATEYIRNTLNLQIPIIALTADVTTVDLEKCNAVGMNDYIAKPVDERILYSKIVGLTMKSGLKKQKKIKEIHEKQIENLKYIDLTYLNKRTKSDPKLMMEMISLYLEQTPPLIRMMKNSFQQKDWNSLYASVHKMIPSFSIMGISQEFENMAKKVQEYASNQQDVDGLPEMVLKLENVCVQACHELEAEFNIIKKQAHEKRN